MSGESSDDAEYKEMMFKKLQAYGDELLGYNKKNKKKKIIKSKVEEPIDIKETSTDIDNVEYDDTISKRKRRKQRKFKNSSAEIKKSHLSKICDVVGIKDITECKPEPIEIISPNDNDLIHLKELNKDSKIQIFIDPDAERLKKKKMRFEKRKQENERILDIDQEKPGEEFNLKKASMDVRRCGITAMTSSMKEDATVALLMELGAKAQKKKHVNYRQFQADLKTRTEQVAKDKEQENLMGIKSNKKQSVKRKRDNIGYLDGQIGVYKRGVQIIGKKDIKKTKRK